MKIGLPCKVARRFKRRYYILHGIFFLNRKKVTEEDHRSQTKRGSEVKIRLKRVAAQAGRRWVRSGTRSTRFVPEVWDAKTENVEGMEILNNFEAHGFVYLFGLPSVKGRERNKRMRNRKDLAYQRRGLMGQRWVYVPGSWNYGYQRRNGSVENQGSKRVYVPGSWNWWLSAPKRQRRELNFSRWVWGHDEEGRIGN